MPRPKTTIVTLSQEMGVSPSTISRALSNEPSISMEVRTAVQALARKRQFKPRLVSNRIINICALVQQYAGHPLNFSLYLAAVLEGISQYAGEENLEMSMYAYNVDELNKVDLVRELRKRQIDGAVVIQANDQSEYLESLARQHFPFCCVVSNDDQPDRPTVKVCEQQASQHAIEHLIKLGHRRIGVSVFPPSSQAGQRRFQGYCDALKAAGIALDPKLILPSDPQLDDIGIGRHAFKTLLKQCPDMTALFVMDHHVTIGAMYQAYEMKLQIPKDISLVSFDDYRETAYLTPPLTTVKMPYCRMGYLAAKQVHRCVRSLEPLDLQDELGMQPQLIVRQSTAAPRKNKLCLARSL